MQKLPTILIVFLLLGSLPVDVAVEPKRPFYIGALTLSWGPAPSFVGLRDGLLELGYREGDDFVLGVRFTQGDLAALPAAAHQLVEFGANLIVTDTDEPARAALQATTKTPIVFLGIADPMGLGAVESFARPGNNVTGVTTMEIRLGAKRLQVFQELLPNLRRVLFPYHATEVYALRSCCKNRAALDRRAC